MVKVIQLEPSQIRKCNRCGADIAFLQNKVGKWYPVNADYAVERKPATYKTNFHKCNPR